MDKETWDAWIEQRHEETLEKTGFAWRDVVDFLDRSTNPPTVRNGCIEIVDEHGGGRFYGVYLSFDIMSDDVFYKHVSVHETIKVTGNESGKTTQTTTP